jgi:hypothetical protein
MDFCLHQVGNYGQKELLQTFDIKGSSVNKVFVNEVTFDTGKKEMRMS